MAVVDDEVASLSRRRFLRLAGRIAAAGAGLGILLQAAPALADTTCCRSNCKSCPGAPIPYTCTGCNPGCICNTDVGQCFTVPC